MSSVSASAPAAGAPAPPVPVRQNSLSRRNPRALSIHELGFRTGELFCCLLLCSLL